MPYSSKEKMEEKKPKIVNISDKPTKVDFDTRGAEKLIFLPDYSPGKGKLPVGTVAVYNSKGHVIHPDYIGPDIGCGMLLAKFKSPIDDLKGLSYGISSNLATNERHLGSLGGGNHFINIYEVGYSQIPEMDDGEHLVLVHAGSRLEGVEAFQSGKEGDEYLRRHNCAVDFGKRNRRELLDMVQKEAQVDIEIILERIHNTVQKNGNVVYRKGAMEIYPGELGVIPSSFYGEAIVVRAKEKVSELENSLNHGTGRKIRKGEIRKIDFDTSYIRDEVYIANFISDDSLRVQNPEGYRTIEEVEELMEPYSETVARLKPRTFSR